MGAKTEISWTQATFNPWWGCTKISPGCDNCYAEEIASRFHPESWGADGARRVFESKHFREPLGWNRKAQEAGKPLLVFCGSMCDVFEKHSVAEEYRPELFTLIHKTPWLRWQLLTKRVGNVARMVPPSWMNGHWPSNAWIGATVVNQIEVNRDVPKLIALPAPVRFLSCEPLLERISIDRYLGAQCDAGSVQTEDGGKMCGQCNGQRTNGGCPGVQWVICGGESGRNARPMNPAWARILRNQCREAGVPFLFKQWGQWAPLPAGTLVAPEPDLHTFNDGTSMIRKSNKVFSGHALDGREHHEFPLH